MLLVALFFAGTILRDILRYGVDIPFWDQWDFVAALRRTSSGEASWLQTLFLSGAEHQLGMQIVLSVLAWNLTQMHMVATMALNWTFAASFCLLAMWVTRQALPPGSRIPWLVLGIGSFFVFNPAAYQVWLWGLPLVHLLIPLLFFAGVSVAQSRASDRTKIVAAALCAFFASFILGSGLLLWFLFPVILIHYLRPTVIQAERPGVLLYATLGVLSVVTYAMGVLQYQSPAPAGGPSGPVLLAQFFFAYTGNLVSLSAEAPPVLWAEVTGIALAGSFLGLLALAFRELYGKKEWPAVAIWSCLGLYSLASGVLVTLGRHGFGLVYAVESSRYVLASAFLPVAIVALACVLIRAYSLALPSRLHLYSGILCLTVGLLVACAGFRYLQWTRADAMMANSRASQTAGKVAVVSGNLFPLAQLRNIYPQDDRNAFLRSANFLNSRGWLRPAMWDDAFLSDLAAPQRRPESSYGFVDNLKVEGGRLQLGGWAYLADRKVRADAIIVLAREGGKGRVLSIVFTSQARRDVFEQLHEMEALSTGWQAEVLVPPGTGIRCFAYDALTGRAHLLPGVKPGELEAPAGSASFEVSGSWTRDGYFPNVGPPPGGGMAFGSWSGADSNTGILRMGPFHWDGRTGLTLPMVTGPGNAGISVQIRDVETKTVLAELTPAPVHATWWVWRPTLPAGRPLNVEIVANDAGTQFGQWLAVGWPEFLKQ